MPVPNVSYKVEIAFTSNWLTPAASRVWTDVSAYVELHETIKIDYGRSDELGRADANSLTLTLDNRDGRFTWGNAASPYYPNVKVGKPIRLTATVGGVDYVRYTGLINEWPVGWPSESAGFATATVTASSRLSRLGLTAPVIHAVDQTILEIGSSRPFYWPMTEAPGSVAALEWTEGTALQLRRVATTATFGVGSDDAATQSLGDGRGAVKFEGPGGRLTLKADTGLASFVEDGSRSGIGFFVKVLNPAAGGSWGAERLVELTDESGNSGVRFGLTGVTVTVNGVAFTGAYPSSLANDGDVHHLAITMTGDGTGVGTQTNRVYVDGVLAATFSSTSPALIDWILLTRLHVAQPNDTSSRDVLIGRLMISTADATDLANVTASLKTGYSGESTAARLARYASWAQVPAAEVITTASPVTLASIDTAGGQVETLMRDVETAEAGVLYDDRNGNLVLKPRSARYNVSPTLTVAFTSDLVKGYDPKVDRQGLANLGKGRGPDGNELLYENTTSRNDYGDAECTVDTTALDPDEPYQLVAWRVNGNAQPRPRVSAPEFSVIDFIGGAIAGLLALDVGSKLRLTNAPSQAPNAASADYFVEGYTEQMGPGTWTISPNLTPAALEDAVLILDDATEGLLDTGVLAL